MQACLPDQGRHPGHAGRRGNGRALKALQKTRLLLIRLREIGDVVFTTPAIRGLRQRYPDAHISYVVQPAAAPVVANNALIDEVIVAPARRGVSGFIDDLALARRLRGDHYDIAVDFHSGPRSSLITWLSGAPMRVGYDVPGRGWMYTVRVPRPRAIRPRHAVENQWDLLSALGIATPTPQDAPVEMTLDAYAAARVAERLAQAGITADHRVVVIHVSAGNPFRRWPLDSFVALIARLVAADAARRVIVMSGPSEHDAAAQTIDRARALVPPDVAGHVLHCGEFNLSEVRALVDRAALYIGGDSGPLHIAATSRVPIVGLYGPTLPVRSAPWRSAEFAHEAAEVAGLPCRPCDQRTCAPGDFRCLTWLKPEDVAAAAERALARYTKNS